MTNGQRTAAEINAELFPYLDWVRDREPFFVFINYFDPHDPYDPPQKYREMLYPGKITWEKGNLRSLFFDKKTGVALFPDGRPLKEKDFQQLRYLYDAEIRYLDEQISRLWNKLKKGPAQEHDRHFHRRPWRVSFGGITLDHGHLLYQKQVRIPFVGPGNGTGQKSLTSCESWMYFPMILGTANTGWKMFRASLLSLQATKQPKIGFC